MKKSNLLCLFLGTTFLTSPVLADDFTVTSNYLNSLTAPKVTWSDDSSSGGTAVNINGQNFYYTYHRPDNYTESSTIITNLDQEDTYTHRVFIDITNASNRVISLQAGGDMSDKSIVSDFVNNTATGSSSGSAVKNNSGEGNTSIVGSVYGDFINNKILNTSTAGLGGAIYIESRGDGSNGAIETIEGNFVNNLSSGSNNYAHGGAIDNHGRIDSLKANFIGNKGISSGSFVMGGALNVGAMSYPNGGVVGVLQGDFIGNSAISSNNYAHGGAINNYGIINDIINSNFLYNVVEGNDSSGGGAIYSSKNLNVSADNGTSLFEGNTVNGESNAIYMLGAETGIVDLNLRAENGGELTFNDDIDGSYYNINIIGDGRGDVVFNQTVDNANNVIINDGGIMRMGTEAAINSQDFDAPVGGTRSLKVDIEVDRANETTKSGLITLTGDVKGDYKVIVNSLNRDGYEGANTMFLTAPNDSDETDENFTVSRIIGSPHEWEAIRNYGGETSGSNWYLALTKYETPEVVAAIGLHQAAIEQTRSVTRNIANKVAAGREYCPNCGVYDYNWDGEKLRNLWVLVNGENAQIDKHIDMEAKIWGIEAGFDMQKDRLGY